MDIIIEGVKKLQNLLTDSGCEDWPVILRTNPAVLPCQYEKGACMEACCGGRTGEFVTFDRVEATTKIGFMYDAPLNSPASRSAACATLNVVTAFLCLSRNIRACPASSHKACIRDLIVRIVEKNVFCLGSIFQDMQDTGCFVVENPDQADIILINAEGLIAPNTGDIIKKYWAKKAILLIGPSVAGIASLEKIERFCPYGI
jgi:hypothetical protein